MMLFIYLFIYLFIVFILKILNIFLGPWEPFKPLEQKQKVRRGENGHTPGPKLATESLSPLCYSHRPNVRWGKLLLAMLAYLGHPSETE